MEKKVEVLMCVGRLKFASQTQAPLYSILKIEQFVDGMSECLLCLHTIERSVCMMDMTAEYLYNYLCLLCH